MSQGTDIDSIKTVNEKPVRNTKFITAAYNIVGIIAGVIALFYNKTNGAVILLMYPFLGIAIILLSRGAIKLNSSDRPRILTSIYLGVLFPIMFMALMSYENYTLLQTGHFWLPFALISIVMMAAFYKASINPLIAISKVDLVFMLLMALAYGYGSTGQINCAFDPSRPQIYNAAVLGLREHRGRSTTDYATLTPWGPRQQVKEEEIDGWLYEHIKVGDTVQVNLRQGLLHIPWFVVTKN